MRHDFGRKDSRGKNCYGYMDYKDSTNYWSKCSVEDFTKTKKSCLKACDSSCDGVDTTSDDTDETDDDNTGTCGNVKSYSKHCEQFKWACTDSRYPWFKENCKKTCNACQVFFNSNNSKNKNNNEEEERNQFDAKLVYKTFNFESS